jgi:hypothetical protein
MEENFYCNSSYVFNKRKPDQNLKKEVCLKSLGVDGGIILK